MDCDLVLINPNRIKPAVAPLGIEYLAEECDRRGFSVDVLDLCFVDDPHAAVRDYFSSCDASLVGLTLRNTDNCYMLSSHSYIDAFAAVAQTVSECTDAPLVVGGAGFSVAPHQLLERSGAQFGVIGDGEIALARLLEAMTKGKKTADIPGLVWRDDDRIRHNAPRWLPLEERPPLPRRWLDYQRYFRHGGQGNIETKRGCPGNCIYCADHHSKGRHSRLRGPEAVVDEIQRLLDLGVDCLHVCDSEFNRPIEHATDVCSQIIDRGLGDDLQWYAYLSPEPFSERLAELMQRAGCVGIDFGLDSGHEQILHKLGRQFTPQQAAESVQMCRDRDIVVMLDLLVGGPGETKQTAARTIEFARRCNPHCVGIALGMRVYPGTDIARTVNSRGRPADNPNLYGDVVDNPGFAAPVFYLSEELGTPAEAQKYIAEKVGADERFFFGGADEEDSDYDYDDNELLVEAISNGARGAYWDILRKMNSGGAENIR